MTGTDLRSQAAIVFGPFRLLPGERLLTRNGEPVALGGRALDILIVLATHANQTVGKRELIAQVWPDVVVDESSLRFQMAELRKALGEGRDGARYIVTQVGRGYCFVATVERPAIAEPPAIAERPATKAAPDRAEDAGFPLPRLGRVIGRAEEIDACAAYLLSERFVTIVGSGGVGKTTLAIAVANHLREDFRTASVAFVDLSSVREADLVPTAVATSLGLTVKSGDVTSDILAHLRSRRSLVILDNCEHLVDAISALAEQMFVAASGCHILATSREALRADGEYVHRLEPLDSPPNVQFLPTATILSYPAAQLFLERAGASGAKLEPTDDNALAIASMCRKLDGVALAIELVAGRVGTYGLSRTAALLESGLSLDWPGRRTAVPRQQTLHAALNWSFVLLTEVEQTVLTRLSVFVGSFALEASMSVVSDEAIPPDAVARTVDSLSAKSLVFVENSVPGGSFRLLDTMQHFLTDRLQASDEGAVVDLRKRHASYFSELLSSRNPRSPELEARVVLANVRAALASSFGANGDHVLAAELASRAAGLFLELSLHSECQRWCREALDRMPQDPDTEVEMLLQASLGFSLMFTRGNSDAAGLALGRALEIAEERGDGVAQLRLLGRLHLHHERIAEFETASTYARRALEVASQLDDPAALGAAHSILGISLHIGGRAAEARENFELALHLGAVNRGVSPNFFGFDYANRARIGLCRTLWLQGHFDEAATMARDTVAEARDLRNPISLCIALIWATSVHLWGGDLDAAEDDIDAFVAEAEKYMFAPYLPVGHGLRAMLGMRRGAVADAIRQLRGCLAQLHAANYELLTTEFNLALAECLAIAGRKPEAAALADETIALAKANGGLFALPELLRIKARVAASEPDASPAEAEACLRSSLGLSEEQGAAAWRLRSACDLAELLAAQGRSGEAAELLGGILALFDVDLRTADLLRARTILGSLGGDPTSRVEAPTSHTV